MTHYADIQVYRRDGTIIPSTYPLDKETCTFGRLENCDIRLQIPQVSKHHCTLQRDSLGYVWLYNHSDNGTFVNDQLVNKHKAVCVHSGDTIRILDRMFRLVYKADELPVVKEKHTPPGLPESLSMVLTEKQREQIPFFHTPRTQHQSEPVSRAQIEVQTGLNYVDIATKQGNISTEVLAFSNQAELSANHTTLDKGTGNFQTSSKQPVLATPSRHGQPLSRFVQPQSEETPSKRFVSDKTGRGRISHAKKLTTIPVTLSRTCSFDMASLYMAKLKQKGCQTPMREVASKSKHLRLAKRRASIGEAHEVPLRPASAVPFPETVATSHFMVTAIPNRTGSARDESTRPGFVSTDETTTNQDSCETTPACIPTTGTVGMVTPKNPSEFTIITRKVTFGPQLSPEVFEKSAPPATPLIRGRSTLLNKGDEPSIKSVLEHPVRVRELSIQNLGYSNEFESIPTTPTRREITQRDSTVSNIQTKLVNVASPAQGRDKSGSLGYRTQPEKPQQIPEDSLFASIDSNVVREIVDDFYDDSTPDQSGHEGSHQLTPTPLPEDLLTGDTPSLQRVGLCTPLEPLVEKNVDRTSSQPPPLDNQSPANNTTESICTPNSGPLYLGVRELLKTPKKLNSHHDLLADSSRDLGIRKMLQTPLGVQVSDSPLTELKHLWATPKLATPPAVSDEPARQDPTDETESMEASPSNAVVENGAVPEQKVSSTDGTESEGHQAELPVTPVQGILSAPPFWTIPSPVVTQPTRVLPTDRVSWGAVTPKVLDSWPVPVNDKSHPSVGSVALSPPRSTSAVEHCTPKQSPESDKISGMAQRFKTPRPTTVQKLQDIKEMFQTPCHRGNTLTSDAPPNPRSSPKPQRTVHLTPSGSNKSVNMAGTQQTVRDEDWTGVRQLFQTPVQRPRPSYYMASGSSLRQLLKTPHVDGWSEPLDSSNHSTPIGHQTHGFPLVSHADPTDLTPALVGQDNTVAEGHELGDAQRGCSMSPVVRVPRGSDRRQTVAWAHRPVGDNTSDADDLEGADSSFKVGHSTPGIRRQQQTGSTAGAVGYSDSGVHGLRRKTLDPGVLPNRPALTLSHESDIGVVEHSPDIDGILSWSDTESITTTIDLPITPVESQITVVTDKPDPVSPTPKSDRGKPECEELVFTPPNHVRTLAMAMQRSKGLRTTPGGARRRDIVISISVPATASRSIPRTVRPSSVDDSDEYSHGDEITLTRPWASNTSKRGSTPSAQPVVPTPSHKLSGKSTKIVAVSPINRQSSATPSPKPDRRFVSVVRTPRFSPLSQSIQKLVVEVESPRSPSILPSTSNITGQRAALLVADRSLTTKERKRSTQPKRTKKAAIMAKLSPANQSSPITAKARKESFSLTIIDRTLPTSPAVTRRSTRRNKQRSSIKLIQPGTEQKSVVQSSPPRKSRRKAPAKKTTTTDVTEAPARRITRRSTRQKAASTPAEEVESEEPSQTIQSQKTRSAHTATRNEAGSTVTKSPSKMEVKEQPKTDGRKRKSTDDDELYAVKVAPPSEPAPARTLRSRSTMSKATASKKPKRETKAPPKSEPLVVEQKPSRVTRRRAKPSEADKEESTPAKPTNNKLAIDVIVENPITRSVRSRKATKRTLATEQDTDTMDITEEDFQPTTKRRRTAAAATTKATRQTSSRKTAMSQAPKKKVASKKGSKSAQSSNSSTPAVTEETIAPVRPRRSTRLMK
ncbi:antigen identified by monoclonal antibody Ki-67 [Dispira simplex]|nr:antigen identified by monoclonal antibody Ki-67 [Dispira simplex]